MCISCSWVRVFFAVATFFQSLIYLNITEMGMLGCIIVCIFCIFWRRSYGGIISYVVNKCWKKSNTVFFPKPCNSV